MKLLLARHPPVATPAGLCYGHSEVPLAPGWEGWARDVAGLCATLGEEVVCYSSPASRCRLPADAIGLDVIEEPRLREMNFGEWEGLQWGDIPRHEFSEWQADIVHRAPPGGEPLRALNGRAKGFLDSMRGVNGDAVLAISHGGPIRCLITAALGMPLENLFRLRVDMGALSTVTLEAHGPVVEFVNFKLLGGKKHEA